MRMCGSRILSNLASRTQEFSVSGDQTRDAPNNWQNEKPEPEKLGSGLIAYANEINNDF